MRNFAIILAAAVAVSACSMSPKSTTSGGVFDGYDAFKRGDYAGAERSFSRILAANPNDPYANLGMGSAMQQTNRPDLARQYYQAAIANGENTYGARTYQARADREVVPTTGVTMSIADLARQNLSRL